MKEDFLHFLWRQKLLAVNSLYTVEGEKLEIQSFGFYNTNSGPDFSEAKVLIGDLTWFGNVEMHLKSSDWYVHNHERDIAYDNVILHVVWEHDVDIFDKNNEALPTLELKDIVDEHLLKNYQQILYSKEKWIPCEGLGDFSRNIFLTNWLERLYFERLEKKSIRFKEILTKSENDWEYVTFVFLAESFGLHLNKDSFYALANSIPFHVFRKVRNDDKQLFALLFGQAGFLEEELEDSYFLMLKNEYAYVKKKFKLTSLAKSQFRFFRTRPSNFPTIRISQLASLFVEKSNLFSSIIELTSKDDFYEFFKISNSEYWQQHYHFGKELKRKSSGITKSFVDLLLVNSILPLKFLYHQSRGEDRTEQLLSLVCEIKSERNSILEKFSSLQLDANNAMESQALLELKNNYCSQKRCLQCAIGVKLVRN